MCVIYCSLDTKQPGFLSKPCEKQVKSPTSEAENILHVIEACRLVHEPVCGPRRPPGKGHAARGLVNNFNALTLCGEPDAVLTYNIAGADCLETDRLRITFAGDPLAAIDSNLAEITTEHPGNHFSHAQGCARWRIDLVPVMRLDNFDIVVLADNLRGQGKQLESEIDADTHVGSKDDSVLLCDPGDARLACIVETCGPDHESLAMLRTHIKMVERRSGRREIDNHVEIPGNFRQIVCECYTKFSDTGQLAGIGTQKTRTCALGRGAKGQ